MPRRSEPHNGIQYVGLPGVTEDCIEAVQRLIQFGDRIERARILTSGNEHCLLLTVSVDDLIAVKSGFSSGYGGSGPSGFSFVLQLLEFHGVRLEEYDVGPEFLEKVDNSALTVRDIDQLDATRAVRPSRWPDYILERDWERDAAGTLWRDFPPVIPFAVVDARLADLAKSFWEGADERLLTAYRRLEDIVRKRTKLKESGSKLFSQAFLGDSARLGWKSLDPSEQVGRGNLFVSAYMAHRNPRAHREAGHDPDEQLREFLLVNHLFRLEAQSEQRRARKHTHRNQKTR